MLSDRLFEPLRLQCLDRLLLRLFDRLFDWLRLSKRLVDSDRERTSERLSRRPLLAEPLRLRMAERLIDARDSERDR